MKKVSINRFALKIIAMITMVVDHFALILLNVSNPWYFPLRYIGRISFPLFALLTVESMIHSRNKVRYIIQLFIIAIAIDLVTFAFGYYQTIDGNPITTLALSSLAIYCLQQKKFWKIFALLPLVTILLIAFKIVPLHASYDLYGFLVIVGFYLCYCYANLNLKSIAYNQGVDETALKESNYYHHFINALCCIYFVALSLFFYLVPLYNINNVPIVNSNAQMYALFSLLFIALYNGNKGYDSKIFKWGCYIFYPAHILILLLIAVVI